MICLSFVGCQINKMSQEEIKLPENIVLCFIYYGNLKFLRVHAPRQCSCHHFDRCEPCHDTQAELCCIVT